MLCCFFLICSVWFCGHACAAGHGSSNQLSSSGCRGPSCWAAWSRIWNGEWWPVSKTCRWHSSRPSTLSNEQVLLQEVQLRNLRLKSSALGLNQPGQGVGKQLQCVWIYWHKITAHCHIILEMIFTTYFSSVIKHNPFSTGSFHSAHPSSARWGHPA